MGDTALRAKRTYVDSLYDLLSEFIPGQVLDQTCGPRVFRAYDSA